MRRPLLAGLLLLALAFAGCVDEPAPAPTAPAPTDTPDEPLPLDVEEVLPSPEPVERPFAFDGASPMGVWVCAAAPALGDCDVYWQDTGDHHHEVPHDGTVIALTLTITFTPATPEMRGIETFVGSGDPTDWTHLGYASGPSGTTLTLTDLNVSADRPLVMQAWNMPDAELQGPIWIDPVPQPYRIEGVLTELP